MAIGTGRRRDGMPSQHRDHWLLRILKPDFQTIADFRRDNRVAFRCAAVPAAQPLRPRLLAVEGDRIRRSTTGTATFTRTFCGPIVSRVPEISGSAYSMMA